MIGKQSLLFIVYLLVQVIILKHVVLFDTAFCFMYILFLLLLPVETNPMVLMGIGFFMGIAVDLFFNSLGLHAMASVFIMYIRNHWLNFMTPQGGYDSASIPALSAYGLQWFLVYAVPLVFLHQGLLFFVEAGGWGLFWFTLWKTMASTLFTVMVMVLAQSLFPIRKKI